MTPETARDLEPGTTPGPWEHYDDPNDVEETYVHGDDGNMCILIAPNGHGSSYPAEDLALIAAAPDMRATIAGMAEEWGVEADGNALFPVNEEWHPKGEYFTECRADAEAVRDRMAKLNPHIHYRLVRRLVGPAEPIAKETPND